MSHADKQKKQEAHRLYRENNKDRLREQNAAWRKANPTRIRDNNLKRLGFTSALFDKALADQGYACAICETDLRTIPQKQVHADHCHGTGMPRGILCHHCNAGLGCFGDNPDRLRKAISYLNAPPLNLV